MEIYYIPMDLLAHEADDDLEIHAITGMYLSIVKPVDNEEENEQDKLKSTG